MNPTVTIAGRKYKVTEDLGYVHDRGEYAKAVQTGGGERIAVRQHGSWVWVFAKVKFGIIGRATGQVIKEEE